ncbi:MAG TPA: FtsX-like permease family protein [Thermoanaerobaculia bacterium]|nr:FtsX-like permease family protein [Thermoanaerobaculia bacterium]
MKPSLYARSLARESRGARGRLTFFVACLAVGVSAVVAVAGVSASLDDGIRQEARQLLAADLVIAGNRPLPGGFDPAAAGIAGVLATRIEETVTVVSAPASVPGRPGPSQLVELKAVSGDYPFYGRLVLRPARPLSALLDARTAVVASELLARLRLAPGGNLRIGGQSFRIGGVVLSEPDRIGVAVTFGPRVFISTAGLARTGLAGVGSRFSHRLLLAFPAGTSGPAIQAAAERLKRGLPNASFYRVETYRDARPELRENLARVERFLGLVALLSLFIGGIGVAQTVRAWLAGRLDAIAVLKCLGMRPREIFALYLGQTALLGLAGSLAGIAAGVAVELLLPRLFPDLIPAALLHPWQPAALLRGLALGLGVALLFSLPPLSAVQRVPAVRVLRREAEPLPAHRLAVAATAAALGAGVLALATVQSRSLRLGAQFTCGVALATAILAAAALLVTRAVRRLPRDSSSRWTRLWARPWLRQGLAALARPGAATMGATVALGLGVLVVLAMSLVERRLAREFTRDLPLDAPTAFLVDIQPDQWPEVAELLRRSGARRVESVPVVTARLAAIDGVSAEALAGRRGGDRSRRGSERGRRDGDRGGREQRWALTREQRLTYMDRLPADNQLLQGRMWSGPGRAEVSVEEGFAEDLGLRLGSKLRFDIEGVPLDLTVTSIRSVNWRGFGINFFLVVAPGVLEQAPQQRLAAVRLPPGGEQRIQDELAAAYPNVTMLRIREILDKVRKVLARIALGVRFLGAFTVAAGIAILAGAVSAGSARRSREVALLKTLGMTRGGVVANFAVEYALVGLVAGAIGCGGAAILAWGVVTRGFELPQELEPLPLAVGLLATILLTVTAGLAASARALQRRPIEVLRDDA